jgi:hypothetical protein
MGCPVPEGVSFLGVPSVRSGRAAHLTTQYPRRRGVALPQVSAALRLSRMPVPHRPSEDPPPGDAAGHPDSITVNRRGRHTGEVLVRAGLWMVPLLVFGAAGAGPRVSR